MSTPSRGRGGAAAAATRGASATPRGRGTYRGNASNTSRGRGRGRGGSASSNTPTNNAGGLLQKLRTGSVQRNAEDGAFVNSRGRGASTRGQPGNTTRARGSLSKTFNNPRPPRATPSPRPSSPAPPTSHRDFMAQMNETFQSLKPKRDAERKKAIQDGFLADPEKKTSLANAITPVGTCTDMCPQFERVERIVQNMVDRAEKVLNTATGRDMPSESRMVKRFRRSAAGYDEQLPSDIRTPETLKKTLDYLLDKVIGGGERLAVIHKFVWDRTRGIRNDFSIQQVTKKEDVTIAVDCYERIARFHILSLHQLSNPENLQEGEHFDAHQEREQLNNTLLSLMYYYDDNRGVIPLPNEPEFRSYCILFELQALTPDIEDRMQAWPVDLLNHPKVQTAFKLYAAAANTTMDQGPLRPLTPFSTAQANSAKFWTVLSSQAVSYIMACVAEINFSMIRFTALDALWRSAKSAPQGQQARNQDWTLSELQNYLAFDEEDETLEFCQAFDLAFKNNDHGEQCLDFTAVAASVLDKSSLPSQQVFSRGIVEEKRYRRTLVAVINGVSVASAIRQGLVIESNADDEDQQQQDASGDDQSMFIPEQSTENPPPFTSIFGSNLNPAAGSFTPSNIFGQYTPAKSNQSLVFGQGFGNEDGKGTQNMFGSRDSAPATGFPVLSTPVNQGNILGQSTYTPQQQPAGSSISGQPTSVKPSFSGFGLPNFSQPIAPLTVGAPSQTTTFSSIFGQNTPRSQPTVSAAPASATVDETKQTVQSSHSASFFDTQKSLQETGSQSFQSLFGQSLQRPQAETAQIAPKPTTGTSSSVSPGFVINQPKTLQPEQPAQSSATASSSGNLPVQPVAGEHTSQPSLAFTPVPQVTTTPSRSTEPPKQPATSPTPSVFSPNTNITNKSVPTLSIASQTSQTNNDHKEPERPFQFAALPAFKPSTTPQDTSKRPQSSTFNFPPIGNTKTTTTQLSLQPEPTTLKPESQKSLPAVSSDSASLPARDLSPKSSQPRFTEIDRKRLVENTSRLILTQPQGLIEYFVSHHVSNLLQPLVKQWLQEQHDEVINRVRTRHLSRKFLAIWRETTQRNILNRRAKQRRRLLAAAMVAEQDKKQRNEMELEAILAATQETKKLQEEQRVLHQHRTTQNERHEQTSWHQDAQVAGHKRKTTSNGNSPHAKSHVSQRTAHQHKRSRTVGTMSEPSTSLRLSTSSHPFRLSNSSAGASRFGQSLLGQSTNSADFRRSMSQKIDSTKTDYFKLKAMGIDPNTPLVPDTARGLKQKKRYAEEAKEALLARSRARPSGFLASTASQTSSPAMSPRPELAPSSDRDSRLPLSSTPAQPPSAVTSDEDPFLRELREARLSLANEKDWLRTQNEVLEKEEKELEEQQDLRRSQASQVSHVNTRPQSPQLVSGFARTNGYTYYSSSPKPGKTLSRTEERIRATGAHGLATKPIGRSYVPVAMSKHSALRYSYGVDDAPVSAGKKRGREELNNSPELRKPSPYDTSTSPATKMTSERITISKGTPSMSLAKASMNAFAALQNHDDYEDDQEDENDEEAKDDHESNYYHHNGVNDGDTEDNGDDQDQDLYDEDEEDVGEDEAEEEDNDDQFQNQHYHIAHHYPILGKLPSEEYMYDEEGEEGDGDEDDDGTPGTYPQFSRAQSRSSTGIQSGPGASADDAVVLSD